VFEVILEESAEAAPTAETEPGVPAVAARPAPETANALKTVDTAEIQAMRQPPPPPAAAEMPTVVPVRRR
jgi:hypothetical protein